MQHTWQHLYTEAVSLAQFASVHFVIESITESADAKSRLLADLESVLSPTTPIASNTSAIPISLLQRSCTHPERILGMHWAEPAYATRFLELIRGDLTSEAATQAATELGRSLGKDPCLVRHDVPGFIANRLGYALYREACHLLATGVGDVETIDRAFRNSVGLWAGICGPFQWIDLTGGAALYGRAMAGVLPTLSNVIDVPEPLASMMPEGRRFYPATSESESQPEDTRRQESLFREHVWRMRAVADSAYPLKPEDT